MKDQTRGADAADRSPKPPEDREKPLRSDKQDAPNYDKRIEGGQAQPVENLNSANDE